MHKIKDPTQFLDFRTQEDREFYTYDHVATQFDISSESNFTSFLEKNESNYRKYGRKFVGIIIMRNLNQEIIVRNNYKLLNMLSDVGGLFGLLTQIAVILIPWFSDYWLKSFLFKNLLHQRLKTANQEQNQ